MEVENPPMEPTEVKSGWADSMARILGSNKPKNKKTLILSRAKKDFEIRKKVEPERPAPAPITIVKVSGESDDKGNEVEAEDSPPIKKSKVDDEEDTMLSVKAQRRMELQLRRQMKEWENLNRAKPDPGLPSEKMRERELVKIATKGVVQLFNAVNLQQKAIKDKLRDTKKSEFKKDKVLHQSKEIFDSAMVKSKRLGTDHNSDSDVDDVKVDVKEESGSEDDFGGAGTTGTITFKTKSNTGSISSSTTVNGKRKPTKTSTKTSNKKPNFKALHDDYMMGGATVKQWNDNSDEDDESE